MFRYFAILFVSIIAVSPECNKQTSNSCKPNSSPHICGTICQPTCKNPEPRFCPTIVCTNLTKACRCDNGFLEDPETGNCVRPAQCTTCIPGQAHIACGPMCEGTCEAPYEPERCQYVRCFAPSCGCDLNNGMVRDNTTDKCIPISQCPQNRDCTTKLDDN